MRDRGVENIKPKIAIKFCGGCNPRYDRLKTAEDLKKALSNRAEIITTDLTYADLIVVITGCRTACADVTALKDKPLFFITSNDDACRFIVSVLENGLEALKNGSYTWA